MNNLRQEQDEELTAFQTLLVLAGVAVCIAIAGGALWGLATIVERFRS